MAQITGTVPSDRGPESAPFDVDHLLEQLTLAEKASLTSGSGFWWTQPIERLGIPRLMVADGPHGLRVQPEAGDHVGLGGSLPATCFPTASALASTWNPQLLRRIGEALAREARATRLSVILGPGINIKRSPLCGRNFEYFSEDPLLAAELAIGIVDGIQSQGVGTSLKHYAVNNQETDRLRVDAQVDERSLREIYLSAFERVVRAAQPWTVMAAYNKVNGTSATEHTWLLDTVLRGEFGFTGVVVSDWGAVYHRVPALLAGTDLEMPPSAGSVDAVVAAVESGELPLAVLDARARAVLDLVGKGRHVLDLDEHADFDAHHTLARAAAAESIVLLQNESGLLPIAAGSRVAVIGEFARTPRFQGAGSSQVDPTRTEIALDELRHTFDVTFAAGYGIDDTSVDDALLDEAVTVASEADVVVLFLGLPAAAESEGFDRTHLDLPPNQLATLTAVAHANPRVVSVVVNGSVVRLGDVVAASPAVLEAWLGGQAAAGGIADVLSGAVNPSGRLAETIPHRLEDNPSYLSFPGDSQVVRYGEGVFVGYRGYDRADRDVLFPFGFGLSYTTFELSGLRVTTTGRVADGDLAAEVRVDVTNTGDIAGAHVVQVYVRDVVASVARPVRELVGFAKVHLAPGATDQVVIRLDQRAFSYWSILLGRWVVEAGEFAIEVGSHSRDLPLVHTVTVEAPSVAPPLTRDSTLHEWLADPAGRAVLADVAASGGPDPTADPELLHVVGTMPMSTLANFPGLSLDHDQLDEALTAVHAQP